MDLHEFKDKLFKKGEKSGFNEMELFQNKRKSFDLRVFDQEIDHYAINEEEGFSLRAEIDGKIGYAYTEKSDNKSIDILINEVKQNAEVLDKREEEIFGGSEKYKDIKPYTPELNNIDNQEKIDLVKSLEKYAFESDDRVTAVNYCLYSDQEFENSIINSKGLDLNYKNNIAYLYLSVVAKEDDDVKTASRYIITQDFSEFDAKKLAKKAVDEVVSLFGSESLPSGKYPVIFRRDVAADILAEFSSTFSAENVQKGMSLFKGKLEEKVANKNITIIDDPFLNRGFKTAPFDGEGVATYKKNIIEKGRLKTFLHNLKTARKAGTESTGNAERGSHKGYIDISPTNMYIKPGSTDYDEIINSVEEGVLVTKLQGLHAGANSVSGDFSLSAAGFYIENGKIKKPVEQITIAGNFIELLKDIEIIGKDLKMGLPGNGHIGSPSLKVKELDIAGK
ncbi:MAG: TldD/PmbA family protein [Bacillota bacterium]